MELKLSRKLPENRLLHPTGNAMATGGAIIIGELKQRFMAASLLRGMVALFAGRLASLAGSPLACWPSS